MREGARISYKGNNRSKRKSKNKKIYVVLFLILILIFFISTIVAIKWYFATNKTKKVNNDIISKAIKVDDINAVKAKELEIDFSTLLEMNDQVVGWIKIDETQINYPIVKGDDNSYYLNHDILKESSQNGWIFIDYRNNSDFSDNNTVIYGHNIKSGIMFSDLTQIYNGKVNNDIYIYLKTGEVNRYSIYSCYMDKPDEESINTKIADTNLTSYMNKMKERSIRKYNVNIVLEKNITLSTCDSSGKKRIIVHGLRQKDGKKIIRKSE